MADIGLKGFYKAKATSDIGGTITYAAPTKTTRAVSATLNVTTASANLFSDDSTEEVFRDFVSAEFGMNPSDLTASDIADFVGLDTDDDGAIWSGKEGNNETAYFAIGFSKTKPNGKQHCIWLLYGSFAPLNDTANTKADSITVNTPTLTGTFIKRPSDGYWKMEQIVDTAAEATEFFAAVPTAFTPAT